MLAGRRFGAILVALGLLLLVGERASAADPPMVHLIYASDDPSCLDEAAVRRGVTERLGFDPFVDKPSPQASTLTATMRRDERGVVARIEMADVFGEVVGLRKLRARPGGCTELGPSVVLAITIAVDPLALSPRRPPVAVAPVAVSPPPESEVAPIMRRKKDLPPPPIPRTIMVGMAGVLIALAPNPTTALGFFAELFVRQRRWSIGLGFRGDLPAPFSIGDAVVEVSMLSGEFMVCGHFLSLYACPILIAGEQRIRTRSMNEGDGFVQPFVALGGRLGVIVPLTHRLEFQARLDLLANVTRNALIIPETVRFLPGAGSAALVVGVGGRFW